MNVVAIVGMVIALFLIFIGLTISTSFNKLTKLKGKSKKDWTEVDLGLKIRYELILELVEVAKIHSPEDEKLFDEVLKARQVALASFVPHSEITANDNLSDAVHKIYVLAESKPELKADEKFTELQKKLSDIEVKIASSREIYNDSVEEYESALKKFPNNLVGKLFGF